MTSSLFVRESKLSWSSTDVLGAEQCPVASKVLPYVWCQYHKEMFTMCGSAIIENAQFCSNCGAAVQETAAAVDPYKMVASKVNSATLDEERAFRLFIGENADYYWENGLLQTESFRKS